MLKLKIMKNIIKFILSLFLVVSFNSCEDSNNTIDEVSQFETGAILRTLEIISNTLNSSDPNSFFAVRVEEQDEEDGALFQSVDLYVSIRDLTPDNGLTVANDHIIKTIDASAFSTDTPHGLPRGTISATFAEAESAMGLNSSSHAPGDIFVFELRLNLTDGRTFGASSAASIITGGFFSSPFAYNAIILCSPEPGDYTVDMQDSYGDGWQSEKGILLTIDGVEISITMQSSYAGGPPCCGWTSTSETVNIPVGTEIAIWDYTGDSYGGEVTFQITGPNGEDLGSYGPSPPVGLLPVVLCAN
jgi:hypothetical protein